MATERVGVAAVVVALGTASPSFDPGCRGHEGTWNKLASFVHIHSEADLASACGFDNSEWNAVPIYWHPTSTRIYNRNNVTGVTSNVHHNFWRTRLIADSNNELCAWDRSVIFVSESSYVKLPLPWWYHGLVSREYESVLLRYVSCPRAPRPVFRHLSSPSLSPVRPDISPTLAPPKELVEIIWPPLNRRPKGVRSHCTSGEANGVRNH